MNYELSKYNLLQRWHNHSIFNNYRPVLRNKIVEEIELFIEREIEMLNSPLLKISE